MLRIIQPLCGFNSYPFGGWKPRKGLIVKKHQRDHHNQRPGA